VGNKCGRDTDPRPNKNAKINAHASVPLENQGMNERLRVRDDTSLARSNLAALPVAHEVAWCSPPAARSIVTEEESSAAAG
jgi:hypothetical protein